MVIPFLWSTYTATVRGAVLKRVTCEGCGERYVYAMERTARGQGTSAYMLDNRGAERRSSAAADKTLRRMFERECDIVPCPACGTVQEDMVRTSRSGHRRWLLRAGIWMILAAGGLGFVNWVSGMEGPRYQFLSWPAYAVIAMLGPAALVVRAFLQAAHDPNDEPVEQRIEDGRARALTEEEYERMAREARDAGEGAPPGPP